MTDTGHLLVLPKGGLNFQALEIDLLTQALQRTGGNQTAAARLLGMNRDQVRYRVAKFKIRLGDIQRIWGPVARAERTVAELEQAAVDVGFQDGPHTEYLP